MILRPFTIALDPTPTQERQFRYFCGASRFAYNTMLAIIKNELNTGIDERTGWSSYSLRKKFNEVKDDVAPWWTEVSKECFSSGCTNLADALNNWHKSHKGQRGGERIGFPKFKKRGSSQSVTFTTGAMRVGEDRHSVVLPRIGRVHTHEKTTRINKLIDLGKGRISRMTLAHRRGRWIVSILVHVEANNPQKVLDPERVVGIDVGVKDWIIASDMKGNLVLDIPVPDEIRRLEERKRVLQRRSRNKCAPSKDAKASNRWSRSQRQIRRIDYQIANIREDVLHKATSYIAARYDVVGVESLSVKGMMTRGGAYKKGLNRAIARSGMTMSRNMIEYKMVRAGGVVVSADRWYPSSKTCSSCGAVKAKLRLDERVYLCDECGVSIGRDLNAAKNLAVLAGSSPVFGRGAKRDPDDPLGSDVAGVEASTLQSA